MSRADLAEQSCTMARAVEVIGDPWTLMVLRELFLGVRRFDDFQRMTGASPHILSLRLKRLEEVGAIRREAYQQRPLRHEYRLTEKGAGLWPVIVALKTWGDRWLGDGGCPVEIIHKGCGHAVTPTMACPDCGAPMEAHDAEARLSPDFERERQAARSHT